MNNTLWFYNSENYISVENALLEAKTIVGTPLINKLLIDKDAKKILEKKFSL